MKKEPPEKTFSYIKTSLKLLFVGVLFYFLAKKGFISIDATKRAISQWEFSLPAMLALFGLTFLGIIRWQWLLRAQDIHLNWARTTQLHFIGQFFNIALPGAVSGDLIKALYISKEAPGKRGPAFGSILFDRVSGLSALVLVSAGAFTLHYQSLEGSPLLRAIHALLFIAALCVFVFYAYLFLVREHHDPVLLAFRKLERKFPRAGSLTRIYQGLRHYHSHRMTVLRVVLLSVFIHLTVCWACISFAHALGDVQVDSFSVFIIVPLGLLVTAIPVMPAGIGTGHMAFSGLFLLLGSQRGADIFSLFALVQLFSGALGGLVYLRFKSVEQNLHLHEGCSS